MKNNLWARYRLTIREDEKHTADYYITILSLQGTGNLSEYRISISFKKPETDPVSVYSKKIREEKISTLPELIPFLKVVLPEERAVKTGKPGVEKINLEGRIRQTTVYQQVTAKGISARYRYLESYPFEGFVSGSLYNREGVETASFMLLERGRTSGRLIKGKKKFRPDSHSPHALRPLLDEKQFLNYIKTHKRLLKKREISESGVILDTENKSLLRFESMTERMRDTDLILAGEIHDSPASHRFQVDLIRSLHKQEREIVIGFEMFYRSKRIQKGLDDFVAGSINEEKFIHTVYNNCWTPDWYGFYRDIFIFARDHNIRLLGLNPPHELMKKFENDPGSLSKWERALFPGDIDYGDRLHRKITKWNFRGMAEMGMDVDDFYPGQCIWEDTMSDTIVKYLLENPGIRMVVCVGALHGAYRVSMPGRIRRMADLRGADINTVSLFPHRAVEFSKAAYHDFMLMDIADLIYYIPPEEENDLEGEDDEISWMEGYRLFSEGKIDEAAQSMKGDYSSIAKKIREKIRIFRKSRDAALSGDFSLARNLLEDVPDIYDEALDIWLKKINKCEKTGRWDAITINIE